MGRTFGRRMRRGGGGGPVGGIEWREDGREGVEGLKDLEISS